MLDYSIDMVRLSCDVKRKDFEEFFRVLQNDSNINYREMTSITAYRHNFYIKELCDLGDPIYKTFLHYGILETLRVDKMQECSFWVGVDHNAKFEKSKYIDMVIEYNPNKCKGSFYLDRILRSFFVNNNTATVKKIDFAIDFPLDITDVHLVRDYKSNYRVFDNGGSDRTYYMRKRGSNGAFKLYNKQLESGLDHVKTRYEVTLHINSSLQYMDSYKVDRSLFPQLRITSAVQMDFGMKTVEVTGTDKILLLACMEHPEYLKELGRKKREKIEELLKSLDTVVAFDNCDQIDYTVRAYFNQIMSLSIANN